jgi:putative ubiquitin-RnfH superfamily antitoxin RatB of RatAB toxin-antitoxin module
MAPAEIHIEVMVGLAPRQVWQRALSVPVGCTLAQALERAGVWALAGVPEGGALAWAQGWTAGVWGRKEAIGHVLREGDRVELVRPLVVDPKEARRVRYRAQGEKLPRGIQRAKPQVKAGKMQA